MSKKRKFDDQQSPRSKRRKVDNEPESELKSNQGPLDVSIRLASDSDLKEILAYLKTKTSKKKGTSVIKDLHGYRHLYVARTLTDELAGYVCFRENINEIDILETLPTFRLRGVGRALVNYCVDHANPDDFHSIMLVGWAAKEAKRFWKRVGFVVETGTGRNLKFFTPPPPVPSILAFATAFMDWQEWNNRMAGGR